MFETIKSLFKTKSSNLEQSVQTLTQQIEKLLEERKQAEQAVSELKAELEKIKEKERLQEEKRNSKEPWVVLTAANYDEKNGFKIELDWNDAFIKQLKEHGIEGPTEEAAIQKWLAFLHEDIIRQLEAEQQQEKQTKKSISDFQ